MIWLLVVESILSAVAVFGISWDAFDYCHRRSVWREFVRGLPPWVPSEGPEGNLEPGCSRLESPGDLEVYKQFARELGVTEIYLYSSPAAPGACLAAMRELPVRGRCASAKPLGQGLTPKPTPAK